MIEQPNSELTRELLQDIEAEQVESTRSNSSIWIGKLLHTASAKSAGRVPFMQSIVGVLNQAADNSSARFTFHEVVREAITSCEDRVALSAVHLDIQAKLNQKESPEEIYKFLVNTVYTMDILDKTASNIIPTLRMTDPIEVYLGLPIKFKDEFGIDINTSEMLYYACSGLTDQHIETTRETLRESLGNKDSVVEFLQSQPKWMEVLENTYPDEFSAAKDQRDEDGVDPDKAAGALKTYQATLAKLSLRLIEEKGLYQPR